MLAELLRTGLPPGSEAPDFELPSASGGRVRLRDLRGEPVLLHFVSYSLASQWPLSAPRVGAEERQDPRADVPA